MFVARTLAGKLSVLVLDEKGRTGGAGAMTDGKLNSRHIGLDLSELQMTEEEAGSRIAAVDEVFVAHGADRRCTGRTGSGSTPGSTVSWVRHKTPKGEWDTTLLPARSGTWGRTSPTGRGRMTESIAAAGPCSP